DFRDALTARRLHYAVGIQATTTVWPPGKGPIVPKATSNRGRPPTLLRRDEKHQPVTVRQLADQLGRDCFRPVTWREGSHGELRSSFCTVRVRPAHLDFQRETPRAEEWLLIEWPVPEPDSTKYWLLTLSRQSSLRRLVYAAKGRWPVERDYNELKAVGLGVYEVRGWRGFHHHATLCIAAYAFLIVERGLFSLGEIVAHREARSLEYPEVSDPAAPPIRPERHNPTSIATPQVESSVAMANRVPRRPFCQKFNDFM